MPHCLGNRLPLIRLQIWQQVTTFSQVVRPPLERGITWSKVSSGVGNDSPQYWQAKLSRRKTLNRVKAGRRLAGMYSFSEITLGRRTLMRGEWTIRSYRETMLTRSSTTALMASCHDQSDKGK